jgi:hypothetical protein
LWILTFVCPTLAAEGPAFLLAAQIAQGDTTQVKVKFELGGDLIDSDAVGQEQKMPLTAVGESQYYEQWLQGSADSAQAVRSRREYQTAQAKIQIDQGGINRQLPDDKKLIFASVDSGRASFRGATLSLTRQEYDLINTVVNSLALDQLLPGEALAEGESWEHSAASIGALLGMEHVAVCQVYSVVTGSMDQQVQLRLAGTVHGTIDGAPTEMELLGAYLFHQDYHRISKFNLAVKESRAASPVAPALEVVAKTSITVVPASAKVFAQQQPPSNPPQAGVLRYEAARCGCQFLHGQGWYVTAEENDFVALRAIEAGDLIAHCNVTSLPARSAGRETTLEGFEQDVRLALGDNLESVTASTQWTTQQGYDCLGVVARGQAEGVPIEWRYYLIAAPNLPRISLGVTIEQANIEKFDDADRLIVESLELGAKPAAAVTRTPGKLAR